MKGKGGLNPDLTMKRDNYARQIRELNEKKAKDKKDTEEKREAELTQQVRLRTAVKEAEQQSRRVVDGAEVRQDDYDNALNDDEDNLILETTLARSCLGVSGSDNVLIEQHGHEVVGVDVDQHEGNKEEEVHSSLDHDSSLETVFGPGATLLARELESNSDKRGESKVSDTELDSDSEVVQGNVSTPPKDQRKKRVRNNMKLGHPSSIQDMKDNHNVSSEEEHSEEAIKEVKKPRLGESRDTREKENDINILEEGNVAEDNTDHSEELAEEKVGDKDHTNGLKEGDEIFGILLNMHEGVPLEDPGPGSAIEDGKEGAAGATQ